MHFKSISDLDPPLSVIKWCGFSGYSLPVSAALLTLLGPAEHSFLFLLLLKLQRWKYSPVFLFLSTPWRTHSSLIKRVLHQIKPGSRRFPASTPASVNSRKGELRQKNSITRWWKNGNSSGRFFLLAVGCTHCQHLLCCGRITVIWYAHNMHTCTHLDANHMHIHAHTSYTAFNSTSIFSCGSTRHPNSQIKEGFALGALYEWLHASALAASIWVWTQQVFLFSCCFSHTFLSLVNMDGVYTSVSSRSSRQTDACRQKLQAIYSPISSDKAEPSEASLSLRSMHACLYWLSG